MKLSVCIVTFNHEGYIRECIESVLKQSVDFSYEVIIAQDCSTDKTGEIVREYKNKYPNIITIIDREKNVGVMQNYEDVFKISKGTYISFLDGDDYMLPGKLELQVSALEKNMNCNVASHPLSNFDSKTGVILSTPHKYSEDRFYTLNDLIVKGFLFSHSSKMFRKSSLPEEIVDKKTKNCTDYLLHLQNCIEGDIIHLKQVLGMHRVHSSSLSRFNLKKGNISLALNDQLYALDKINKSINIDPNILKQGYRRILLWGYKRAIFVNDVDEIKRIRNIWNVRISDKNFPKLLDLFYLFKPAVKISSVVYSLLYFSRGKIKLLINPVRNCKDSCE